MRVNNILLRMMEVVRTWKLLRILYRHIIVVQDPMRDLRAEELIARLAEKRTLFGRKYGVERATGIFHIVETHGHIHVDSEVGVHHMEQSVTLKSSGITLSSYTALVNSLAGSIVSVSPVIAIGVSLLALYVSVAYRK